MNDYQVNYDFFFKQVFNDYFVKRLKWIKKNRLLRESKYKLKKDVLF